MCVLEPSDSKILFNLWGWLWLSMDRVGNSVKRSLWIALETQ
ncbi:hypothetical protein ACO1KB_05335 [Leptospira interrogans serovar Szwajizak]